MRNRLLPERSDLNQFMLNLQTEPRNNKCKVLPYLKSINYDQPIDYRLYENLKRMRKVQVVRPQADLFL
jgi:hypothetical protein